MATYCPFETNLLIKINKYGNFSLQGIGALLMLPLLYVHVISYIKKQLQISTTLFIVTTIFYLSCFMAFECASMQAWFHCYNKKLYYTFQNSSGQFYVTETVLLCGILYYRLYFIFRKTRHRLSKCTNISFWIFYGIMVIVSASAAYTIINAFEIGSLITSLAFMMILSIIVFLDV